MDPLWRTARWGIFNCTVRAAVKTRKLFFSMMLSALRHLGLRHASARAQHDDVAASGEPALQTMKPRADSLSSDKLTSTVGAQDRHLQDLRTFHSHVSDCCVLVVSMRLGSGLPLLQGRNKAMEDYYYYQ
jgi:hypothetical protein